MSQVAYQASVVSSFCRMKRLGVFLLLDGLLVHCRVTTSMVPISHTSVKRGTESKVPCPSTQHNVLGPGLKLDH